MWTPSLLEEVCSSPFGRASRLHTHAGVHFVIWVWTDVVGGWVDVGEKAQQKHSLVITCGIMRLK